MFVPHSSRCLRRHLHVGGDAPPAHPVPGPGGHMNDDDHHYCYNIFSSSSTTTTTTTTTTTILLLFSLSLSISLSHSLYIYIYICIYIYTYIYIMYYDSSHNNRNTRPEGTWMIRKGGWHGRKPSSSSNVSIRYVRPQSHRFELFELNFLLKVGKLFSVEQFKATASHSRTICLTLHV